MDSLKILSINYNGNKSRPRTQNLPQAEKRREIVTETIETHKPDIIFIQEPNRKIAAICSETYGPRTYDCSRNDEAGIAYDISTLELVPSQYRNPNDDILKLRDRMVRRNELTDADELLPRLHAVILRTKGPLIDEFLCISYHGPKNKYTVERRLNVFNAALKLINEYQIEVPIPVIFAGDFNVDIQINLKEETWIKVERGTDTIQVTENGFLCLHPYEPTGRRQHIYDFMLTSEALEVSSIEAIDIGQVINDRYPDIEKGDDMVILDHDPLVACISACNRESILHSKPSGYELILWKAEGTKDALKETETRPKDVKRLVWC